MDAKKLAAIVKQRAQLSADIAEATDERKFLDFQITEHMEENDAGMGLEVDGYKVTIVPRKGTRKLDSALLLAAGVAPTTIAKCTVEGKPSQSLRITAPKESA